MTNTRSASRPFAALDTLASDAYRRFVSVTDDGYSAATNRSYFDLPVTAGPVPAAVQAEINATLENDPWLALHYPGMDLECECGVCN